MKIWLPFSIACVLAVLINLYPWFMAFDVGDEAWIQAGWALYFMTIPIGLGLIALGLVLTGIRWYRVRKAQQTE